MKTYPGIKLSAFPEEQREQMRIVDDILRMVSGGLSRSISSGQSPYAITTPAVTNPTGPPPQSGTPTAAEGDLLVGLANGSWTKLAIGAPGSLLRVDTTSPTWLGTASQLGWTGEWRANGPYQIGNDVDGILAANTAMTLTDLWITQANPGTGGPATAFDLLKNGSIIGSFSIAFNETGNKKNYALSNIIAAGDKLSINITAIQSGTPRDLLIVVKGI